MTYYSDMVTFIEAPLFSKYVHDYLSDEEYADFLLYLAGNPDSGDIVQGSGGIRKVRWQRKGHGKSSGVRIMYFVRTAVGEIWLLLIYAKSATDNIPGQILKAIKEEMEHV